MTTYFQTAAESFTNFAQGTNNYMQDVRIAGRLWCLGRDNIAIPLATLAGSAWVRVQPTLINLAGWLNTNAAPVMTTTMRTMSEYGAMVNNHMQDARYVGRVWCLGRDVVAIPMTTGAGTAWTGLQPTLGSAAGWLATNAAPVTLGIVLLWAASRAIRR